MAGIKIEGATRWTIPATPVMIDSRNVTTSTDMFSKIGPERDFVGCRVLDKRSFERSNYCK